MINEIKNKILGAGNYFVKKISRECLEFGIKHNPDVFNEKVIQISKIAAQEFVHSEMQSRGITHCALCLTRHPLFKIENIYLCEKHYKKLKPKSN